MNICIFIYIYILFELTRALSLADINVFEKEEKNRKKKKHQMNGIIVESVDN